MRYIGVLVWCTADCSSVKISSSGPQTTAQRTCCSILLFQTSLCKHLPISGGKFAAISCKAKCLRSLHRLFLLAQRSFVGCACFGALSFKVAEVQVCTFCSLWLWGAFHTPSSSSPFPGHFPCTFTFLGYALLCLLPQLPTPHPPSSFFFFLLLDLIALSSQRVCLLWVKSGNWTSLIMLCFSHPLLPTSLPPLHPWPVS